MTNLQGRRSAHTARNANLAFDLRGPHPTIHKPSRESQRADPIPSTHPTIHKPSRESQRADPITSSHAIRRTSPSGATQPTRRTPDTFPKDRLHHTQSTNNTRSADLGFEVRGFSRIHRPNLYDLAWSIRKEYDDALSYIHVNPVRRGSRGIIEAVLIRFIFSLWP